MSADSVSESTLKSPRRLGISHRAQDNLTIVLFLLPGLVLFLVFVTYPIFQSVYYSLFDWNGFGPAEDFVGIDNFARILTDKIFIQAVQHGIMLVALSVFIQLPLSLVLAVLVARDLPGRAFYRMIFFLPYVFSEVITAIIWSTLLNPDPERGFINAILVHIPGVDPQAFLGNPDIVLQSLFVVLTWKYFGLHLLLFLTGLQNIPREIEEAARIDGANRYQLFAKITIPLLGSTIRTSAYLSIIGSLQQFILVWILTKGGPVNASEVMATYMYRYGFVRFWLGYGSAVAIVMFLISFFFSLIYQWLSPQRDYLGGI